MPDARSAGVELELAAQPATFFDFAVSASMADARLQSTITSTDAEGAVGVVSGIEAGRRLPTTPRFQAAATWRWLAGGGWVGYVSGTFRAGRSISCTSEALTASKRNAADDCPA